MPLVVILAGLAVYRNRLWAACAALLLAGLPYLLLRQMVGGYQPSDDGDVIVDQATGRQALGFYVWLVRLAAISVFVVAVQRLRRRGSPSES